ncbi:MAG: hypothetical protein GQ523_03115 [Methanophagales archaeon]|jgi:hypothetical protein|nr:hypothetical protein [Methanophagales archaeon]
MRGYKIFMLVGIVLASTILVSVGVAYISSSRKNSEVRYALSTKTPRDSMKVTNGSPFTTPPTKAWTSETGL